jgi:predicted nucleic acid-binding protein
VRYTIDTNLYIDAIRDPAGEEALSKFLVRWAPQTHLNAVVMQELRAGARTAAQVEALESGIFERFERVSRTFGPSIAAFKECGMVLAELWRRDGVTKRPRSLVNDILLAASCREHGFTLITTDQGFAALRPLLSGFRYVAPWP